LIIKINNISISYGQTLALDSLSLNVKEGAVGLLGPNGAGKTTLLKILLGFLLPDNGTGEVLGMDIKNRKMQIRQKVGYMPEDDCYIPDMNAVSFVAYTGELCGMPRTDAIQRAHEVLYYVGLEEARYRMIQTYSAGMRQRIKLAQALVHDPELLFLDEPTNGMDPNGREEMLELIKDISTNKDVNIILSSHLLSDVEYTCENVIVLHKGRLIIEGNIEELRNSFHRTFEVKIKGDEALFNNELKKLGYKSEKKDGGIFRIGLPDNIDSVMLFRLAAEHGMQIRHLRTTKHSLEDIFAEAVEKEE